MRRQMQVCPWSPTTWCWCRHVRRCPSLHVRRCPSLFLLESEPDTARPRGRASCAGRQDLASTGVQTLTNVRSHVPGGQPVPPPSPRLPLPLPTRQRRPPKFSTALLLTLALGGTGTGTRPLTQHPLRSRFQKVQNGGNGKYDSPRRYTIPHLTNPP